MEQINDYFLLSQIGEELPLYFYRPSPKRIKLLMFELPKLLENYKKEKYNDDKKTIVLRKGSGCPCYNIF